LAAIIGLGVGLLGYLINGWLGAFIGFLIGCFAGFLVAMAKAKSQPPEVRVVAPQATDATPAPDPGPSNGSAEARLDQLNSLRQRGLIDEQEYAARRKAIVDQL
jgi:hypothetical protein